MYLGQDELLLLRSATGRSQDQRDLAGIAGKSSGPLRQIRTIGHGGKSGRQPCREPAGQGRVRPIYRGEGHPGARRAQRRDQGCHHRNTEIRHDDHYRERSTREHRIQRELFALDRAAHAGGGRGAEAAGECRPRKGPGRKRTAKPNAARAEAQANADATRLNGEARASNIKITGEAEAAAIEARAKALGTNPNLVTLVQAEKWNGVLPTTMVPGSAVPFVSLK